MEAEERPSKLRKLNSIESVPAAEASGPLLPQVEEAATDSGVAPLSNSKPTPAPANLAADNRNVSDNTSEEEEPNAKDENQRPHDPDPAAHERLLLQRQQKGETATPISKSQLKKLRRREEWEAGRDNRKAKRKQKNQERKARKREVRDEDEEARQLQAQTQTLPEQDQNGGDVPKVAPALPKLLPPKLKPRRHVQLPITILIDCGFDSLMMEKERISLGSQITRAYSDNHRAPYQAHLVISSWGGLLKDRFDTVLNKHYLNWKGVRFEEGDFVKAAAKMEVVMQDPKSGGKLVGCFKRFSSEGDESQGHAQEEASKDEADPAETSLRSDERLSSSVNGHAPTDAAASSLNPDSAQKRHQISEPPSSTPPNIKPPLPSLPGEIVYLTSDSPHTLTALSPYSTYIIGGLVDKNRHKGICYKTACSQDIKTAKLPIGEFLEMSSRKVLATNHVVEILLRWMEEAGERGEEGAWGRAFLRVIPKRKGGKLKGGEDQDVLDEGDGEDDHGLGQEEYGVADDDNIDAASYI